jgi:DNA-binding MarR family transcriptional regulator
MSSLPPGSEASPSNHEFARNALLAMTGAGVAVTQDLTDAGVDPYLIRNHPMATLLVLTDGGPRRPVELAGRVGMTSGGMTKVIDKLEALGLVDRDADVIDDGRGVLVSLTREGHRAARRILEVAAPALRKAVDDLRSLQS